MKFDTQRRNTNRQEDTTEDEIGNYTRVHILSHNPAPSDPPSLPFHQYVNVGKPCPKCGEKNATFRGEKRRWSVANTKTPNLVPWLIGDFSACRRRRYPRPWNGFLDPYEVVTKPCPRCGTENTAFKGRELEWSVANTKTHNIVLWLTGDL